MTTKQKFDNLLRELHRARSVQETASAKVKDYRLRALDTEEYRELERNLAEALDVLEEADKLVREFGIQVFLETRDKHPHSKVSVLERKRLVYDCDKAREWAFTNLPKALILDTSFFEKHAAAVNDTNPIDFVLVALEPSASIAKDLSEYLQPESNDESS